MLRNLLIALLFLLPAGARAEWRAAQTEHFIVYSESSPGDVEKLAAGLESYDRLMRMATGIRDDVEPVKVRIYEVASTSDVEDALGLHDSGVAGFYDSNIFGPFAVTPRKTYYHDASFTPELVLHHEYAHHFMLQYFPSVYPGWYVEGFAELIASSKIMPDGRIGYGMPAKHRGEAIAADWVHLRDLLLKPPHKLRYLDTYGQGWALTHFFTFSKVRAPQMRAYLVGLRNGKSAEEAARVFGDLEALNREARRYVASGAFDYKPVPIQIARPAVKAARKLSPGEAALIPEIIAHRDEELSVYRREGSRDQEAKLRAANLARIRDKARRYSNDPFALHVLAAAEYTAGHRAEAAAAAERLIALDPNHARGLAIRSLTLAEEAGALTGAARTARAAEARRLALRANAADRDDTLPLLAFYQSFHLAGEKPSKEAVGLLEAVVETQPGDNRARQLLVDEYAAQHRWAEAIGALMPIANSPHESPRRAAAQEQLEKLLAELAKAKGEKPEA
jgi:tetratricopeptide (TPR) repeat protein